MEILGYTAAVLMGVVLGVIGGGGSILTVPILVYLFSTNATIATAYSLLIVGATAAFGAIRYYRQGLIEIRSAITFAVPSILAVYLTRAYLMPAIPDVIMTSPIIINKDSLIMVSFAMLMVLSAVMMLTRDISKLDSNKPKQKYPIIIIEGAVVGVATGILGAGGGFLIIPALVLLMGMDMKKAVGTSLLIIAFKSLIGFTGDLQAGIDLDWTLLSTIIVCTVIGMWIATLVSAKIDGKKLQNGFGYFTLVIAVFIFAKELI